MDSASSSKLVVGLRHECSVLALLLCPWVRLLPHLCQFPGNGPTGSLWTEDSLLQTLWQGRHQVRLELENGEISWGESEFDHIDSGPNWSKTLSWFLACPSWLVQRVLPPLVGLAIFKSGQRTFESDLDILYVRPMDAGHEGLRIPTRDVGQKERTI